MATHIYNPNTDKQLPQDADKSREALIAEMAAKTEESLRRKSGHQVTFRAAMAKETPDGARREFAFQAEFRPDPELVDTLFKGALAVCLFGIGVSLLRGQ